MAQISAFFEALVHGSDVASLNNCSSLLYSCRWYHALGIRNAPLGAFGGGKPPGARPDKLNLSPPFSTFRPLGPLHWSCPGGILPPSAAGPWLWALPDPSMLVRSQPCGSVAGTEDAPARDRVRSRRSTQTGTKRARGARQVLLPTYPGQWCRRVRHSAPGGGRRCLDGALLDDRDHLLRPGAQSTDFGNVSLGSE